MSCVGIYASQHVPPDTGNIETCILHLDASNASSIDLNASKVLNWRNIAPAYSNTFTQPNPSRRPIISSENGLDTVLFDHIDDHLSGPFDNFKDVTEYTFYYVVKRTINDNTIFIAPSSTALPQTYGGISGTLQYAGGNTYFYINQAEVPFVTGPSMNTLNIYVCRWKNTPEFHMWLNNVKSSYNTSQTTQINSHSLVLGDSTYVNSVFAYGGEICEIKWYIEYHSDTIVDNVTAALSTKWVS